MFLLNFLDEDINKCIRKGQFPDELKTADMTPAFKKGDKHDKSNQTTDQ